MESTRGWGVVLAVAVAGASCGPPLPLPVTASQLHAQWSGPVLVEYLGQADASASVCSLPPGTAAQSRAWLSQDVRVSLMFGLSNGVIPPPRWRACADQLVRSADAASAVLLLDAVVAEYTHAISDGQLDRDPRRQARVDALQSVYLGRPADRSSHSQVIAALEAKVATARAQGRMGPWAARHALAFVDTIDIERGWFRGHVVELATLDWLFADGDEGLLRDCSQRLPAPDLRAQARRRVIRLHIQASSDPDVRAHAAAIEETVMKVGANPVSLDAHPPVHARLDLPVRQVRVRQRPVDATAVLLASAQSPQGVSLLPELPLRGALQVDVEGLARPVTVCAPAAVLDPAPCVSGDALAIASPLVTVDHDGVVRFTDHLSAQELERLAREAESVVLPVSVAGQRLSELQWALAFEKPADLIFTWTGSGPELLVRVTRGAGGRLIDTIDADGKIYLAVVEAAEAARFRIVSSGIDGASGSNGLDGSDGLSGMSGSSASCMAPGSDGSRGGDGSNGGDGGDGGGGGAGGPVRIEVACGQAPCADLVALAKRTISSEGGRGGAGGKGGRGGRGGPGGSGGSGTTCTSADGQFSSVSGGQDGLSGSDGLAGRDGSSGFNGSPGPVTVVVVP